MDALDLLYEMGDISDYLVMEAREHSPQMRERVIVRLSTIAASVCLVMAAVLLAWRVGIGAGIEPAGTVPPVTDGVTTEAETDMSPDEIEGISPEEVELMRAAGLIVNSADDIRCIDENDMNNNHYFSRYYGMYHGGFIFFEKSQVDSVESFIIAGYGFYHPSGFNIYLYRNGVFYPLADAYNAGLLLNDDIAAIAESHQQAEGADEIDGIPRDEVTLMRALGLIVNSADDIRYIDEDDPETEHIFTRYYGMYTSMNSIFALFEEKPGARNSAISVADSLFTHDTDFEIYIFDSGRLYTLGRANDSIVAEIAEVHRQFEPAEVGCELVEKGGVVYRVYDDRAEASWVISGVSEIYMADEINGVPVTIPDGVFDNIRPLRIYCDATYDIYETARAYAIEHDHIFIETNSGKYPDHYYPDWVTKLDWQLRDTSGDEFVFVDDNARITELVNAYLSGDNSAYDELLQRTMYRYACTVRKMWWFETPYCEKYEHSPSGSQKPTDYDRYYNYCHPDDNPSEYEFAFGYIGTYEELHDYIYLFYTEDVADKFFAKDVAHDRGGAVFMNFTGFGYTHNDRNPTYTLHIDKDKIVLSERREIWELTGDDAHFTGEYNEEEIVLENHDGKWQMTRDDYYDGCVMTAYEKLYGG